MKCASGLALLLWAFVLLASSVSAHSMSAALLRIDLLPDGTAHLLLKVPRKENGPTSLGIKLPDGCEEKGQRKKRSTKDAYIESWQASCTEDALRGGMLRARGLNPIVGELFVHLRAGAEQPWIGVLKRGSSGLALRIATPEPTARTGGRADGLFALGVAHILSGPDHLLFVFALLLLIARAHGSGRPRKLAAAMAWTITAFTVAHSITLAVSVLGLVRVPTTPVEIVIPLSVLLLAVELTRKRPEQTLTARHPWAVAFAFGLLHGFGFAGALREMGIPEETVGGALLLFNLGVEAGQLIFLGAIGVCWGLWRQVQIRRLVGEAAWPGRFERVAVYGIGVVSVFWCLQRAWMS
jgi:hydrogenase/urease accessory protein HupE